MNYITSLVAFCCLLHAVSCLPSILQTEGVTIDLDSVKEIATEGLDGFERTIDEVEEQQADAVDSQVGPDSPTIPDRVNPEGRPGAPGPPGRFPPVRPPPGPETPVATDPDSETREMIQRFLGMTKDESFALTRNTSIEIEGLTTIQRKLDLSKTQAEALRGLPELQTIFFPFPRPCQFQRPIVCPSTCTASRRYRTTTGSCNNLVNKHWGASFRPMQRLLGVPSTDFCDGISTLRCKSDGTPLPSARLISRILFRDFSVNTDHTNLLMTMGQFLDHDIGHTAASQLHSSYSGGSSPITCGFDGCQTGGFLNRACAPIDVQPSDPDFLLRPCLTFVRSLATSDEHCTVGSRENLNQITSYLDMSNVYGSTNAELNGLRSFSSTRGRMKVHLPPGSGKGLLPQDGSADCVGTTPTQKCFKAGDVRVNEQNGLTALHTIWVRYHNIIERQIHSRKPTWTGEKKFQESRRLANAVYQHIIINEYLPKVIGSAKMTEYDLNPATGYYTGYDATVNADALNVFQTAAFRYGHSLVGTFITSNGAKCPFSNMHKQRLSNQFFNPSSFHNNPAPGSGTPLDKVIFGQVLQKGEDGDDFFTKEITAHLFASVTGGIGTDLAALNIQRGRDHGLPSYNRYRQFCGLDELTDYTNCHDIPSVKCADLQTLYPNPDDIDLYAGAMLEDNVPGGKVGPTFACIIGRQFRNLRKGDRYWFERQDSCHGFSLAELAQIRKMTLAKVLCEASDEITHLQERVLRKTTNPPSIVPNSAPGDTQEELLEKILKGTNVCPAQDLATNPVRCCHQLPNIDFTTMFGPIQPVIVHPPCLSSRRGCIRPDLPPEGPIEPRPVDPEIVRPVDRQIPGVVRELRDFRGVP